MKKSRRVKTTAEKRNFFVLIHDKNRLFERILPQGLVKTALWKIRLLSSPRIKSKIGRHVVHLLSGFHCSLLYRSQPNSLHCSLLIVLWLNTAIHELFFAFSAQNVTCTEKSRKSLKLSLLPCFC